MSVDIDPSRASCDAIVTTHQIQLNYGRSTRVVSIEHETFMNEEFFRTSVVQQLEAARRVGRVGPDLRSKTNGPEGPSLDSHASSGNQSRGKRGGLIRNHRRSDDWGELSKAQLAECAREADRPASVYLTARCSRIRSTSSAISSRCPGTANALAPGGR